MAGLKGKLLLKLNIFQFAMQQITDPKKYGKTKS